MSLPKQSIGLTNFYTSISRCPANPDAIRSIVFTKCDNLSVVNGAATEIQISLTKFFVLVDDAARVSFTIPSRSTAVVPYTLDKMDLGGLDDDGQVKFICLFPSYGTAGQANQYIEWASVPAIEEGTLQAIDPQGPSGSSTTYTNIGNVRGLDFTYGSFLSFTGGTGTLWAATDGGLLSWSGSTAGLYNTLNSEIPNDHLTSIVIDASDRTWLGSSGSGLILKDDTFVTYDTAGSGIVSDYVLDVALLSTDRVVVGTTAGMSILNIEGATWSSFTVYNTSELHHNKILKVSTSSDSIFLGTTGGVYMYTPDTDTWGTSVYSSSTVAGWSAPDSVQAMKVFGDNLFVGTTGGLVMMPHAGGTATVYVAGATGPLSSNVISIRAVDYTGTGELYVGHPNGFSVLNLETLVWSFTGSSASFSFMTDGVVDILPDYLSGLTSGKTAFLASPTEGIGACYLDSSSYTLVPKTSDLTDAVLVFPGTGDELYSIHQPLIFTFTKDMTGGATSSPIENFITLKNSAGATVTGSWSWSSDGKTGTFSHNPLERASMYNLAITNGGTASDGSYLSTSLDLDFYAEDIVPELGWNTLGKMLVLTGATDNLIQGLYLRNPQSFDVNIIALIGR